MKKIWSLTGVLMSVGMFAAILSTGCDDNLDGKTYYASNKMTIVQTLEQNPEEYSTYLEILHITDFYTTLSSYGSYTCLVPVNEAWTAYFQERWKVSSLEELNTVEHLEDLKELIKFHTVSKARKTSSYYEGRMPDTTYTGDFLTTSFLEGGGISNVTINREAKFVQFDISADNGVIHSLNKVLIPYSDPVSVTMENAGKHTIFIEALKQTGLYDQLLKLKSDNGGKMYYTVFAESDSVFALSGINSFDDLANQYADSAVNYTEDDNGLYRFMAYHVMNAFFYTSDLPDEAFLSTLLDKNAIKVKRTDKNLKLNETETGGSDSWVSFVSQIKNMPAKNGVYHTLDTIMNIFVPSAAHVIFDVVSEQPEYKAKLVGSHQVMPPSFYQNVNWYPESVETRYLQMSKNINLDYNIFDLSPKCLYYEFKTPILPKGKYTFLICANGGNSARGKAQVYWDENPIGPIYDLTTKGTSVGFPDSVAMEANGWRHGKIWITNKSGENQYDNSNKLRFIVTKELLCPEQKEHWVRLVFVKSGNFPLDYFEFIPTN